MSAAAKPPAPAGKKTARKPARPARTRAREFALQGLYQHFVGGGAATLIDEHTRELQGFAKADAAHYAALLHGCIERAGELDALIAPLLDRPLAHISPIEHGCMWIGAYELLACPDVPWRVALNECIELAKDFGGTDGHKYVNAVLNGVAQKTRPAEIAADRAAAP